MAKTKEQKEKVVKELTEKISRMKSVVLADYYGLKVKDLSELRSLLKKANCQYLVTKKSLLELVLKRQKIEGLNLKEISGGIGLTFCWEDEANGAKILANFAKEHKFPEIKGGILVIEPQKYRFLDGQETKELAKLPTKVELLIKTFLTIKAPVNNLVCVLRGNLQGLVYALNAIKEQK
jgi:large subunit ribosomal protein L10